MIEWDISEVKSDEERRAFGDILYQSLAFPSIDSYDWLPRYVDAEMLVARDGGDVAGCAALVDVGQFFGGRRVAMGAVNGVGVRAQARGRGAGTALMRHIVEGLAERGVPLSCLYPATQPVYRAAGYEQAGTYTQYAIPVAAIAERNRAMAVRAVGFEDWERLAVGYTAAASQRPGHVDRSAWFWRRVLDRPTMALFAYSVGDAADPEGHITLIREAASDDYRHDLICNELVWRTPDALERLLSLVADHRSMARNWLVSGPPNTPGLPSIPEQCWKVTEQVLWMLRIIDVEAALTARGYPPGLCVQFALEITDPWVERNNDRFVVSVDQGMATVTRGGDAPALRMDVRGLAPLYSGHRSAAALCGVGAAAGDDDAVAVAGAAFAGPAPWIPAIF